MVTQYTENAPPPIRNTTILKFKNGLYSYQDDKLAAEEPLSLHIAFGNEKFSPFSVLMRTIGDDSHLAFGLLFSEGIITDKYDLFEWHKTDDHTLCIRISEDKKRKINRDNIGASSACGACGKVQFEDLNLESVPVLGNRITFKDINYGNLMQKMDQKQSLFRQTGGIHSASLFSKDGEIKMQFEDIGRHNAVDKIVGWALMNDFNLSTSMLLVSGRCGYEIVHKAAMAKIPLIISIGAPSSLAVELADKINVTIVGFFKKNQHNIYTHPQRILNSQSVFMEHE